MKLFYLALAALLLNFTASFAQDTVATDKSPDAPVVSYSFDHTAKNYLLFDKIIPFDRQFTIRFTSIPATINYIKVRILRYNTSKVNTKKPGTYSSASKEVSKFEFDLDEWKRPDGDISSRRDMIEIISLLPNTDYQLVVETGAERPLTDDEKNKLRNDLQNNSAITNSIQLLANTILSTDLNSPQIIDKNRKEIVSLLSKGVKDSNPKFNFTPPPELKITDEVKELHDQLRNVRTYMNDFKTLGSAAAQSKHKTVTKRIFNANYGTISDAEIIKLSDSVNAIVAADTATHNKDHAKIVAYAKYVTDALPKIIAARQALFDSFLNVTVTNTNYTDVLAPTYSSNFLKSAQLYVTLDLGYAYVSRIDRTLAYSGVNLYLRPIDKGIPLNHYFGWDSFKVRTSMLIGISMGSVAETNVRKGLIGDQALVLGLGYRILTFFKFNAGCFVHYRYDHDPVITPNRYYTSLSPFVSFSIDFDAKSLFSGIGTSILK